MLMFLHMTLHFQTLFSTIIISFVKAAVCKIFSLRKLKINIEFRDRNRLISNYWYVFHWDQKVSQISKNTLQLFDMWWKCVVVQKLSWIVTYIQRPELSLSIWRATDHSKKIQMKPEQNRSSSVAVFCEYETWAYRILNSLSLHVWLAQWIIFSHIIL